MGLERKGFFMPFVREQSGGTPEFVKVFSGNTINGLIVGKKYLLSGAIVTITSGGTLIETHRTSNSAVSNYFIGYIIFEATDTSLVLAETSCGAICLIN